MRPHRAEKNLLRRAKQPTRSRVLYEVLDGSPCPNGGTYHEKDSECAGCGGPGGHCCGAVVCPGSRQESRSAESGTEPFASGAGAMERHRPEAGCDCGRLAGEQIRLQAKSRLADFRRAIAACVGGDVFFHRSRAGEKALVLRRPQPRKPEDERASGGVREEMRARRRGCDQDKERQRLVGTGQGPIRRIKWCEFPTWRTG